MDSPLSNLVCSASRLRAASCCDAIAASTAAAPSSSARTAIRTYLDYRKANIGYRYSTGTLLDFLEVGIVDPGQPDVPNDYWKNIEWLQFDDFAGPAGNAAPAAEPAMRP